ncbi:MAG: hypothetical protein ACRCRZ_02530 [Metamycoplasmataceae bacterium]
MNSNFSFIKNKVQDDKTSITTVFRVFNKTKFFFGISFINSFMPIFLCIIASFINPYGAQSVMGVGYVAAFLLTFSQIGISFAISTFFIIKKRKLTNDNLEDKKQIDDIMSHSIMICMIIGVLLTIIYAGSSYLYMFYSCNRPNTLPTLASGLDFTWSTLGYIFIICLNFLLILYIKFQNKRTAWIIQFFNIILTLILSFVLGVYTSLGASGIGLGLSLATLISLIVTIIIICLKYPFRIKTKRYLDYSINNIKEITRESVAGVAVSFFKGVGILILGLALPVALKELVPLSYQMARLIWFNLMYALVWFSIGISDSIKYYSLTNQDNVCPRQRLKWFNKTILLSVMMSIIFCFIAWFLVEPLAQLYIQNGTWDQSLDLSSLEVPEAFQDIIAKNDPKGSLNKEWFINLKENDPASFKKLTLLLLNPTNLGDFKDWALKYISFTSYDAKIITSLLNYNFHPEAGSFLDQIKLGVALEGYNSKSTFYIFIYVLLCSCWTVILPATTNITKRNVNGFIIAFVYAASLAFLISFGVNYSILDTNPNNWFRFLDAWTFPLMLIAATVWLYTTTKWILINIKYAKLCHCYFHF